MVKCKATRGALSADTRQAFHSCIKAMPAPQETVVTCLIENVPEQNGGLSMNKKTLILAGGGHTHVLLLKRIQRQPVPCRVLLLSGHRYTPYSGMLPGVIAGLYEPEEAHIDLATLAADCDCGFLEDDVVSLDAEANQLVTAKGEILDYDWLSINTGSTQSRVVDGPDCISLKPVIPFLSWLSTDFPQRLDNIKKFDLVIIGAGAAGVEVALAMTRRFHNARDYKFISLLPGEFCLDILPEFGRWFRLSCTTKVS